MFPRLRQRLSTTVLDRLDLVVELSTLGEFGLAEDGRPLALEADRPLALKADRAPTSPRDRSRDDCPLRGLPAPSRCADS